MSPVRSRSPAPSNQQVKDDSYSGIRVDVPRKQAHSVAFSSRKSHLQPPDKGTLTLIPLKAKRTSEPNRINGPSRPGRSKRQAKWQSGEQGYRLQAMMAGREISFLGVP